MGSKFLFHVALLVLLQITANIFVVAEEGAFVALRGSQMETERFLEDVTSTSTSSPTTTTTIEEEEEEDVVIIPDVPEDDDIVFDDDLVDGNTTDGNSTDGNSTLTDDEEEEEEEEELSPIGTVNPLNNGGNILVQIKWLIQNLQRTFSLNRDDEAATQKTALPGSSTRSIFLARLDSIERTVPNDLYVRK